MTGSRRASKTIIPKGQTSSQKATLPDLTPPADANLGVNDIDPRDAVEEFFRSAPPLLKKAKGHTTSRHTRSPQDFDRHLHADLILHHVINVPSIASDLLSIAQNALDSYNNLPPINASFPTKAERDKTIDENTEISNIKMEREIQRVYGDTTAQFCIVVGATLAFQLPRWSSDGLEWKTSKGKTTKGKTTLEAQKDVSGIEDPQQRSHAGANADGFLELSIPQETGKHSVPEEVVHKFPKVAVWEFKNMKLGDIKTMNDIVTKFKNCELFPWEGCKHGLECLSRHEIGVTRCTMGFDAAQPVCPSIQEARDSLRRRRASNPSPSFPGLAFTQIPKHVLQQVWAEAVKHDTTFMIIHSGNLEIICQRDRDLQALYLSDIIHVPDCNYYQLHTGLYIAAIRDARERALLLKQQPLPTSWTFGISLDVAAEIAEVARSRDFLSMSLVDVPGRKPGRLHFVPRSAYKRMSSDSALTMVCEDNFFRIWIHYTLSSGNVLKGDLEIPGVILGDSSVTSIPVVVKTAEGELAVDALRHEYRALSSLENVEGVAKAIGLYEHMAVKKNGKEVHDAVLVMQDMGKTVIQLHEEGDRTPFLLREQLNG